MPKSLPDTASLPMEPKGEGHDVTSGTADGPAIDGWWNRLLEAARRTPPSRDRYVDFLRLIAILAVVTGHWLMPAPYLTGGVLRIDHLLNVVPWSQWLTWLFQVMPVFFFVGGYANGASWQSPVRQKAGFADWLGKRLMRLVLPLVPLILFWTIAGCIALFLGKDLHLMSEASRLALIPVWFLAVYIMIVVAVPVTWETWHRFGFASVVGLGIGAVASDALSLWLDALWIRWANYGFIWLAVHQLGYGWRDGSLSSRAPAAILICVGLTGLAIVVLLLGYPISMVTVPGAEMSNSRPPSTALLWLAMVQIGVMLFIASPIREILRRQTLWALVIAGNQVIMTLFLWHVTALISCIGLAWLLGGVGLHLVPGSVAWWLARVPWILAAGLMTMLYIVLFYRVERNARPNGSAHSVLEQVAGAIVTCGGVVFLALGGIISETSQWIAILPLASVAIGIGLIVHSNGYRLKGARSMK